MTPTNLALLFPDWNSLDSVRNAHSLLELWAIWLFAALVVCDIVAHLVEDNHKPLAKIFERIGLCCFAFAVAAELAAYKYGQRNDELSQQVISSLDTKAQNAATNASKALTDSGTALGQSKDAETRSGNAVDTANKANAVSEGAQERVAVVEKEADVAEYVLSARRVRDEDGLKKDFEQQYKGKSIVFKSYAAATDGQESFWLCSQLADIAHKAGVNSVDECATEQLPRLPSNDLLISAPTHEEAEPLARLLMKPKRVSGYFVGMNQATPQLTVLIGIKESLPLWPDAEKEAFKAAVSKKEAKP